MAAGDEANSDPAVKENQEGSSPQTGGEASQPSPEVKSTSGQQDEAAATPEVRNTSTLSIKSLGHPIGLRASYPKSWIRSYKVQITKPASWGLSSKIFPQPRSRLRHETDYISERIMRGLKVHSTYDLMGDVIRCGLITQGQLAGHIMGILLAGSRLDDTTKKYLLGLTSGNDAGRQALSNEKI